MKVVLLGFTLVVALFMSGCDMKDDITAVVATADTVSVQQGSTVEIDVLDNDSIIYNTESLDLVIDSITRAPSHGTVVINSNNSITYTPNDDYSGPDNFIYVVVTSADDGLSDSAAVLITVEPLEPPANQAPSADAGEDKTVQAGETITITGTYADNDGTVVRREWKKGSTLLATTAEFEYTPEVVGIDTLKFTVEDDDGATASDEMNVTVTEAEPENRAPVAEDKNVTIDSCDMGSTTTISLVATDEDGDALSFSIDNIDISYGTIELTDATNGTVTFNINDSMANGMCMDRMDAGSFTYKAYDGTVYSNVATVKIKAR